MTFENFFFFIVLIFAFYATPGPATISLVASGVSFGFKKSIPYVWGLILGVSFVTVFTLFGLIYLISIDDRIIIFFKIVSLLYMLFLVIKIWNADKIEISKSNVLSFNNGVIFNLINPKAYIAAVAVLTQFISSETETNIIVLIITTLFAFITMINFGFCYLGETFFKVFSQKKKFNSINKIMAILLLVTVIYFIVP